MSIVDEARFAVAQGDRLIGIQVYWTGLTDLLVPRATFRDDMRRIGLGAALGDVPSPEALLSRAVGVANRRIAGERETRTKLGYMRLKSKTDKLASYAVLMRRDQGVFKQHMGYVEEATVSVDRDGVSPQYHVTLHSSMRDDVREQLIDVARDSWHDQLHNSDTQEISCAVVKAMHVMRGIPLRTGVYLVHPDNYDTLKALEKLMAGIGAELELWEIRATERNTVTAKANTVRSLRERFTEIADEVRAFRAGLDADTDTSNGNVFDKPIATRVRRFKELASRVDLFADILGDTRTELLAEIETTKQALLGDLLGSSTAAA